MADIVEYYSRRARVVRGDLQWRDQNRQEEQGLLGEAIKRSLKGSRVLEVACDTGH